MIGALAAGFAAVATLLLMTPQSSARSLRLPLAAVLGVLGGMVVRTHVVAETHLVVLGIGVASATDLLRRRRRRARQAAADRLRAEVARTCAGIAADVRAGLPPGAALAGAAIHWRDLTPVARAAELGGDVPTALRGLARQPGAEHLAVLAAAWQVAHRSGAALAPALDIAVAAIREQQATASLVATEVAGARATASLLALLPVGVLMLGAGVGGDPWSFLLGTVPGVICLGVGLLLVHLGLFWIDRIATGVER